ncbi:MAG TPA: NrsF family protein [Kofleriaceae bacterium]|nr:NrsF family protein [Kofleriaceae bacterium]
MSPTNGGDERLAETLRGLGAPGASVPPLHPDLERELGSLQAVSPRRPLRQLALFSLVSLSVAGGLLAVLTLRRDLELLPRAWLIAYSAGWFLGFLGLGALALLPARHQVSPRWRAAGIAALGAGAAFVVVGLLLARSTTESTMAPATAGGLWDFGRACLSLGLVTAITPVLLGTLFLRGAAPVGARWVGWALGAAGGALGGLLLHLHCPIADHLHLGVIHGGVVVIAGLLSALIVDRLLRP